LSATEEPFRWGVLGCGRIADKWAIDLALVPGARLQAAWSRDPARAQDFAELHGAQRAAASVADLLGRGDLDAVYVATPHGRHRDDVLACLAAEIPTLCEKAFALDVSQAAEMVRASRDRGVFLMEALWTRFLPGFGEALSVADSGEIGQILSVSADFGFRAPFDPAGRLWDPAMGGGALLDIGLYPLFFALSFLGPVASLEVERTIAPNGVDARTFVRAAHRDGGWSQSDSTLLEATPCRAVIQGSKGRMEFLPMFHTPTDVVVETESVTRTIQGAGAGGGYQFETAHAQACVRAGLLESPLWSLDRTLELMELLDAVRARAAA
jgi:predicted dehydrogenase